MIRRTISVRDRIEQADLDDLARRTRVSANALEGVHAMLEKCPPVIRESDRAVGQRRHRRSAAA